MTITHLEIDFIHSHTQQCARVIEQFSTKQAVSYLSTLPATQAAHLIDVCMPSFASQCLNEMTHDCVLAIFKHLQEASLFILFPRLSSTLQDHMLAKLPTAQSLALKYALNYPEYSVGSIMQVNDLVLTMSATVEHTLTQLKAADQKIPTYLYVTHDNHKLVGMVDIQTILQSSAQQTIADIMQKCPMHLSAKVDIRRMVSAPIWLDYDSLPVVDKNGCYIGTLYHAHMRRRLLTELPTKKAALGNILFDSVDDIWQFSGDLMKSMDIFLGNEKHK